MTNTTATTTTFDSGHWPFIVAGAILVPELISLTAKLLQRSAIGSPLPPNLQNIYDPEEYAKSNAYSVAKSSVSLAKDVFDMIVFFSFWFLGGFAWLDERCAALQKPEVVTGLIFIGAISVGGMILDLPWSIYRTFVLEERFGFNNTTPITFLKDQFKGLLLALILGAPLLALVLWFFTTFLEYGWLYVFLSITVFQLILLFLMPVLILPIFLEMIPLPVGKSVITCEQDKASPLQFLSARVFYGCDQQTNSRPCWAIRDKRFAMSKHGAKLSIYWKDSTWVLAEGEPGAAENVVYATAPACAMPDEPSSEWALSEVVSDIIEKAKNGAGTPLVEDKVSSVCVDVGNLKTGLMALADKLGYVGANIFVIDGSTRSSHSNAFCTGFGRFRRICLFDTLLPNLTEHEIISILGHEIGHDRLYHVHKSLVFSIVIMFVTLYAMGQLMTSPIIAAAFFVAEPKVYVGIVLFSLVWGVLEFFLNIPLMINSRSNEYAADQYSIDADKSHASGLATGLTKLMKKSKVNLTPHWLYTFLNESHPPLGIRLQAIDAYKKTKYS